MKNKNQQSGFIKIALIIIISVSLLVYYRTGIRNLIESPRARTSLIRTIDARADYAWYGFLVWYDRTSRTFGPLIWVQGKVNRVVDRIEGPNASSTKALLREK